MLKQLYIRNYALFGETQVTFSPGLNILTGETGAGKSLLVGALGLITGKRADSSVVFRDDEKCIVEARFGEMAASMIDVLKEYDAFDLDEEELLIRREITTTGKSRAFINDTPVSLQILRQVSTLLVDMHSQHENRSLLSHDYQLELLDLFAGCEEEVDEFKTLLTENEKLLKEIKSLEAKESHARQQLDYYLFQLEELNTAQLKADEEAELEQELNLLQNSEEVREALGAATEMLYHQDESLYTQISALLEPLRKVSKVNNRIAEEVSGLEEIRNNLKETAFSFQQMLDTVESDPERLAYIEDRLAIYHKLKLKYGAKNGAELVSIYEDFQAKVKEFQSIEGRILDLRKKYDGDLKGLTAKSLKIENKRKKASKVLAKEVCQMLTEVGFAKARFEIAIERNVSDKGEVQLDGQQIKLTNRGMNRLYFVIQTNPGMPAGPLSQIASGGEVSRVMLAVKAALAGKADFPVLIFDEIDTGISGEIANKVGTVMQKLGSRFQILSITHLPQIAAKGNHHFQVYKEIKGNKTTSFVSRLSHNERVRELAKMLSGDDPTESAMKNAAELIEM